MPPAHPSERFARTALLLLALIPLLLFAYLGSHSRMTSDDYCHIHIAQELDALQSIAYWRDTWNGSYTDHLVANLMAPLGMNVTAVFPALTILVWLMALSAFVYHGAPVINLGKIPLPTAVTIAAFVLTLAIDSLFSPQSIYFYAAIVRHTLAIAGITALFALLVVASRRQFSSNGGLLKFALAAGVLCFFNAGTSEIMATLQLTILSAILLLSLALPRRSLRNRWNIVPALGFLATLASLLIMATAPGASVRVETLHESPFAQHSDIATQISESIGAVLFHLRDPKIIRGFVAVLALGFFLSLSRRRQSAALSHGPTDSAIRPSPLLFALAHQLLCLPFLWAQVSDNPLVLGRFSLAYSTMVLLNFGLILGLALLLVLRPRANGMLAKHPDISVVVTCLALLLALLAIAIMQMISIDWRASTYLYASLLALLITLSWLWSSVLPQPASRRFWIAILCWYAIAMSAATAVIFFSNLIAGTYWPRILAFFPFAFIFPGLIWAAYQGYAITGAASSSRLAVAAIKSLRVASLAVALFIGANAASDQLNLIPLFQQHSDAWDLRHQQILDERERGQRTVFVAPISFSLARYMRSQQLHRTHCPLMYYDLDSIVLEEA